MSMPQVTSATARRPFFAGVDVGGTTIKIGLVDDNGSTLAKSWIATQEQRGVPDAVERIRESLQQLALSVDLTLSDIVAIGLGTPGTMDIPGGLILEPPNLPAWRHFPIRDALSQACGKPVTYANDAGAAAYGEFWVGSGRAYESICLFTLGTGVGGGVILDELSLDGAHSHGAEFGHIVIDTTPQARICSCGKAGHLDAYASATAVVAAAIERLDAGVPSSLRSIDRQALTALSVASAAEDGDTLALELIDDVAARLGLGIATVTHVIDPAAVILGGAMNFGGASKELGRRFLERIAAEFRRLTFPVQAAHTVIDFATLGGDAGYIGAAGLARLSHRRSTSQTRGLVS